VIKNNKGFSFFFIPYKFNTTIAKNFLLKVNFCTEVIQVFMVESSHFFEKGDNPQKIHFTEEANNWIP